MQKIPAQTSHGLSLWIGLGFVVIGVFLNVAALARYRRYLRLLAAGVMPVPRPRLETALALGLTLIGLATIISLLAVAR